MRRALVVLFASFVAFGATPASAAWTPGAGGNGTSAGTNLGLPTSVAANATSSTAVQITWAAPGSGPAPTQYVVRRTSPSTATVCTVAPPTMTCNDTGLTASTTYLYTVQSRLGANWSSGQTTAASVTTPAPPTLNVALVPTGTKTAGTAFNVTLTATTNGTTTNTAYSGSKTITFSGPSNAPSGVAPTYPSSVTFTAGVGTASITLRAAESVTLDATDGTISGSTSVAVAAGTATQLQFSSSSVSCASGSVAVGNRGSWTTKVTAYDTWFNPKSGTTRTVSLTRSPARGSWSPTSLSITSSSSETTNSSTYTRSGGNKNVTVTAAASGLTSDACLVRR